MAGPWLVAAATWLPLGASALGRRSASTLLVSFTTDPASVTLARAVRAHCGRWEPVEAAGVARLWAAADAPAHAPAHLLEIDDRPVHADHVDVRFAELTGGPAPAEVLFLSRHASASARPALCVHPIGNPRAAAGAAHGGSAGFCPPPAPRLAQLYRLGLEECARAGLDAEFETTLEATHHGPTLERAPSAFVEIGSDESAWRREDAAAVWARALRRLLGTGEPACEGGADARVPLWAERDDAARAASTVVLAFGGGHYMPALCDAARASRGGGAAGEGGELFLGHLLASYALTDLGAPRAAEGAEPAPAHADAEPEWHATVASAVSSTAAAFPGAGRLLGFVPKKAFRAGAREALREHLARAHGIECVQTKGELLAIAGGRA